MLTKRIIPCLDVKDGRVVKGVNFSGLNDVSSPISLAEYYSSVGADELVFYDITASSDGRKIFTDILRSKAIEGNKVTQRCSIFPVLIPLFYSLLLYFTLQIENKNCHMT